MTPCSFLHLEEGDGQLGLCGEAGEEQGTGVSRSHLPAVLTEPPASCAARAWFLAPVPRQAAQALSWPPGWERALTSWWPAGDTMGSLQLEGGPRDMPITSQVARVAVALPLPNGNPSAPQGTGLTDTLSLRLGAQGRVQRRTRRHPPQDADGREGNGHQSCPPPAWTWPRDGGGPGRVSLLSPRPQPGWLRPLPPSLRPALLVTVTLWDRGREGRLTQLPDRPGGGLSTGGETPGSKWPDVGLAPCPGGAGVAGAAPHGPGQLPLWTVIAELAPVLQPRCSGATQRGPRMLPHRGGGRGAAWLGPGLAGEPAVTWQGATHPPRDGDAAHPVHT